MQCLFVIQARVGSERLPGKVLEKIGSLSLVEHIAKRIQNVGENLLFAIADEADTGLYDYLDSLGLPTQKGHEEDVLSRYVAAASELGEGDYVVRCTGDNPFIDMAAFHQLKQLLAAKQPDLAYLKGVPLGMGYEAIRVGALRAQLQFELLPHHREHVSIYLKEHRQSYNFDFIDPLDEDITDQVRLTVDTPDDLALARKVFKYFSELDKEEFDSLDVYQLFKKDTAFLADNQHVRQRRF